MTHLILIAELPDELVRVFTQHIRNFDTTHQGCNFRVAANAPNMTMADIMEAVKLDPPLLYQFFERTKE